MVTKPPRSIEILGQELLDGKLELGVDVHARYLELEGEAVAKDLVEYAAALVDRRVHRALDGLDAGRGPLGGRLLAEGEERLFVFGDKGCELLLPLAVEDVCVPAVGMSVRLNPALLVALGMPPRRGTSPASVRSYRRIPIRP